MSLIINDPSNAENNKRIDRNDKHNGLDSIFKSPRMTKEFIKKLCKEQKLYQTPYLNDVLYLHFKGFSYIENLEEYTGLKCLWLENNGIKEISGLDNQKGLRSLFLHYNLIKKIENLENCSILDTLNLAHNQVKKIENLDCVTGLHTLNLSNNYVESLEDLEHLEKLIEVSVLDLANNHIEEPLIVQILGNMPGLRVLNLMGNPVIRKIPAYRKTLILACKNLQYLDDRPIFPRERACAEAWERGGIAEEHAERKRWIDRERQKIMDSVDALIALRDRRRAERAAEDPAQHVDSGFCTSIADSESEAENLSQPNLIIDCETNNEDDNNIRPVIVEEENSNSDEKPEVIYGAAIANGERHQAYNDSESSATDSESSTTDSDSVDSDDFMKDRQTTEDYSAYRTRIFDYSPEIVSQKKILIQELNDEPQPCSSKQAIAEDMLRFAMDNADIEEIRDVRNPTGTEIQPISTKSLYPQTQVVNKDDNNELETANANYDVEEFEGDVVIKEKLEAYVEIESQPCTSQQALAEEKMFRLSIENVDNDSDGQNKGQQALENDIAESCDDEVKENNIENAADTREESDVKVEKEVIEDTAPEDKVDADELSTSEAKKEIKNIEVGVEDAPIAVENCHECQLENCSCNNKKEKQLYVEVEKMNVDEYLSSSTQISQNSCHDKHSELSESICEGSMAYFSLKEPKLDSLLTCAPTSASKDSDDESDPDDFDSTLSQQRLLVETLDKCEDIRADTGEIGEGDFVVEAKSKKELQASLGPRNIKFNQDTDDEIYKNLLKWDINVPEGNTIILEPIQRKQREECNKDEICEMILQSKKVEKPEYEIVPGKDIAEENDTILYSRHDIVEEDKSNKFSKTQTIMCNTDVKPVTELDNATIISKTISEVREEIKKFNKSYEEFNERSKIQRAKIIEEYNDALDKEVKIINKFKTIYKKSEKKPREFGKRGPIEVTDESMRKHFADMGVDLSEDFEESGLIRKPKPELEHLVDEPDEFVSANKELEKQFLEQLPQLRKIVEDEEAQEKLKEDEKSEKNNLAEKLMENVTDNGSLEKDKPEEKIVIKRRNVSCSLEMQLAQDKE
ncbi:unnamed protein product [Ceutorhynchus assimilis]|uniref:Dynein axonemal assembly factor 1 homolog n=1 Tax=Ceutorhynchus assimilis TaxID=467358 RepID=A0A9N9MSP5_9CUCU|nr:unnamed protein product [Ceutorhynchus assimilis]